MKISPEEVRELAELAQLRLEPDELARMQHDLEAIVEYVDKLAELDTTGVSPTLHALDLATPLRDDATVRTLEVEEALRNSPEREAMAYVVPKVVE